VQGVWYRASTQQQARALGLTGQAVNLPDGRVVVVACGDARAVEALCAWLRQGPELAQVTDVEVTPCSDPGLADFLTG
jgi:acylphosphatase